MIFFDKITKSLNFEEKKTFFLHLCYSIIEGFIAGVFIMNEFVFVKSLHCSSFQVSILFQASVIVLLFSMLFNEILKRVVNKTKIMMKVAIFTRLPMILLLLFPGSISEISKTNLFYYHTAFIIIFWIYHLANPFIFPIINLILKNSYTHENYGKMYSFAHFAKTVLTMLTTFLYGILLDYYNFSFRYVLGMVAVMGFVSIYLLSRIKYNKPDLKIPSSSITTSIKKSFGRLIGILKNDHAYRHFEIGFMLYGISFMIITPITAIFFQKILHLNYSSIAFYKNSYNILALIFLPFFGKLIGKIDTRKFAVITFSSLLVFCIFLALTEFWNQYFTLWNIDLYYSLIIGYIFHGFFAATMPLLWNIGSSYFCRNDESADYQSAHLFLTGIRGAIAPLIGVSVYIKYGFLAAFGLGACFLIASVLAMIISMHRVELRNIK